MSKIKFSIGYLLTVIHIVFSALASQSMKLYCLNNGRIILERDKDDLLILFIVEWEEISIFIESFMIRDKETWIQTLSLQYIGKGVHAWIAFRSVDRKEVSNSTFPGLSVIV